MGIYNKAMREERSERFEKYLLQLKDKYDVREDITDKFTIETEKFGTVDCFPKANKILIRKQNKWIKPGFNGSVDDCYKTKFYHYANIN